MRPSSRLGLALLLGFLPILVAIQGKHSTTERREFRGMVIGEEGPVEGACVHWQGIRESVRSDANGRFRLAEASGGRRITASKDGYFIAGARPDSSPLQLLLKPLPAEDHPAYEWVDPAPGGRDHCGSCHGEIYREWAASGHARSATGRHFRNLYEGTDWRGQPDANWGLLRQYPDGAGVCASCHAPAVAHDDPAVFDLRKVRGIAAQGVHCDYCHKISSAGEGTLGLTHGRFGLRLLRPTPGNGQLFFGPLDDVDRGEDAYSPLYRDSRYCASCHEGVVFGVHVYSTYSEWLRSPARREGKHCQDCHLTPTGRMTNVAPERGGIERDPRSLGNHRFFDGSQEEMLRRCLRVTVAFNHQEDDLRATLEVRAEDVGHRVPSGFVDRHLLLVAEGFDRDGGPVAARSGPRLPALAGPELAGKSGRLYAKLLKDFDGRSPAPFWRADPEPQDTRLTPGEPDVVKFAFPPNLARLRVRVLYRRFWQEVAQAKNWPDRDLTVLDKTIEVNSP
jgi:hypothetical protein